MKPVYEPVPVNVAKKKPAKRAVKKKPIKRKTAKREMTVALKSIRNSLSLHYVKAESRKEAIIYAMQIEYCETERECRSRYKESGWDAFVFPGHIGETV